MAETSAQPSGFAFIPILRLDQLRPRGLSEDNRKHLRATLLKFGFQGRPRYASAPIFVERSQAASKLRFLRTGQWKLLMFQTVPKLRDQRQTFRGRQTNDLISSEQFHAFQPTKKRTAGQA